MLLLRLLLSEVILQILLALSFLLLPLFLSPRFLLCVPIFPIILIVILRLSVGLATTTDCHTSADHFNTRRKLALICSIIPQRSFILIAPVATPFSKADFSDILIHT